jgi:steroid delta-isomerase-like uncharacterized protein
VSLEQNKTILRRTYDEWWNAGDMSSVEELVAEDYVDHSPNVSGTGRAALKELILEFRRGFPDMVETLEDAVAEGDLVVGRFRMRGTHAGTFLGIPPTGRTVEMTGIDIYRIAHGRIVEMWYNEDLLGMMRQLGAV